MRCTLGTYIKIVAYLRGAFNILIINIKNPHRPASVDSIGYRIRATLAQCGIGREFRAYRILHAALLEALKNKLPLSSLNGYYIYLFIYILTFSSTL